MRILIAHSFYRIPGGEDRYVDQLMSLLERRHDVQLLARSNAELKAGPQTLARMIFSRRELSEVTQTISLFDPDVIHIHNVYPSFGPAVHFAAERLRIPLVMTIHNLRLRCPNGFMFTEGAPCRRCESGNYLNATLHHCFPSRAQAVGYATSLWAHRFLMRTDDKVDLFLTPSDFIRRRMISSGLDPEKTSVVRIFTEPKEASNEPGRHGLYLGRISYEKGLDDLLRALKVAGDPHFVFVGQGPRLQTLKRLAAELGLTRTSFRGWLSPDQFSELLHKARYVALPSVWDENSPLAGLEAMAAGRPLLVTRMGGLPELVANGEGLICEASDVTAMAEHIRTLMEDDELCRVSGARGLTRARTDFAPDTHLKRLEEAYESVMTSFRRQT